MTNKEALEDALNQWGRVALLDDYDDRYEWGGVRIGYAGPVDDWQYYNASRWYENYRSHTRERTVFRCKVSSRDEDALWNARRAAEKKYFRLAELGYRWHDRFKPSQKYPEYPCAVGRWDVQFSEMENDNNKKIVVADSFSCGNEVFYEVAIYAPKACNSGAWLSDASLPKATAEREFGRRIMERYEAEGAVE